MIVGGTVSIAEGTTSITVPVPAEITVPYLVKVVPGWPTDWWVLPADKTAVSVVVNFTVPAPPGGSTVDGALRAD
jgi:hypothetical protein